MSTPAGADHRGVGAPAVVGIVGPADLVDLVADIAAREFPALDLRARPYRSAAETVELIEQSPAEVDAWLFTGIVPYDLAQRAGILRQPATYLDHTGATLYRALVERLAGSAPWDLVSIDTLRRADVLDALREAHLPTDRVRVRPFRTARDVAGFAAFHRETADHTPNSLAITCVRSVAEELTGAVPTLRLVPALSSIRGGLRAVSLVRAGAGTDEVASAGETVAADAQVAIGLVDLARPSPELDAEARRLAGVAAAVSPTRSLIVTTRDVLAEITAQFRELPLLERLRPDQTHVHVGFGVGRTAAAAEARAHRALGQARAAGDYAAVVSFGDQTELTLVNPATGGAARTEAISLPVAERRSGVSQARLLGILQAAGPAPRGPVTATAVARSLGLEDRSARRLLERLVRAGVADASTTPAEGLVGRPPKSYFLRIS